MNLYSEINQAFDDILMYWDAAVVSLMQLQNLIFSEDGRAGELMDWEKTWRIKVDRL